jgi:dihydroorotase
MSSTAETYDLIVKGGTIVTHEREGEGDIGISAGRIAAIGSLSTARAGEVMDARGLHVLPGVIDTHVHFREPGMEHKEDIETGSRAAVAGGVTAVFEMPNTRPPTVSAEGLADKIRRARGRAFCDFAFYIGATRDNVADLPRLERLEGCAGIKVYMGSTTGDLLVPDEPTLERIVAGLSRRSSFHAEDEARLEARRHLRQTSTPMSHTLWRDEETALCATERLVALAERHGKCVHVLHVSTAEELAFLAGHKRAATIEVTPHHLTLASPECYERLGTYAQMNPPLRNDRHRRALWAGITSGVVDVIGSDHAPHTRAEKEKPYPESPSGMPGVQTLLPLMLDHVNAGRLTLSRLVALTSLVPARLFSITAKGRIAVGYDADLTLVDLRRTETISNGWIQSKCGWTPYDGKRVTGWPVGTIVRGRRVMWEGEIMAPAHGAPMRFSTL